MSEWLNRFGTTKPTKLQKGYTSKWSKESKAFLAQAENYFCVRCKTLGRLIRATQVDHIVPHRGDSKLFWRRSNWQGLCNSCGGTKSRHEQASYRGHSIAERGCTVNGLPLDKNHPWNQD